MVIEQLSLAPGASASGLFIEVSVLGTEPGAEETVADSSAMSLLSQSVGSGSARQVANHQRIRSETSGWVGKQGGDWECWGWSGSADAQFAAAAIAVSCRVFLSEGKWRPWEAAAFLEDLAVPR